jgi:NAD(P)H-hydrate epimerase
MVMTDENDHCITAFPDPENFSVIGFGPGTGLNEKTAAALKDFLNHEPQTTNYKLIIDADGLNILSLNKELLNLLPKETILTPHPKEFERLFGKTENDFERLELQRKMSAKYNCIILLKGHYSIVTTPQQEVYINSTGNAGMATAGTGDVLTGIITGLRAQHYPAADAAILGMYLHGMAGDLAAKKISQPALTASDIIHHLGEAFLQL